MKKLLIQPCVLMMAAVGMLFSACKDPEVKPADPTVTIEFVGTPGVSSVTAKFIPTPNADKYVYAIGSDQDRENFVNGDVVGMVTEMSNQEKTQEWKELEAGQYYVIYAMAYDAAGAAGPVSALGFKTSSDDFTVTTYYVGDNSAGFMIRCTNDYYQYSYALGKTPEDKEKFLNNMLDGTVTKNEVFEWGANYLDLESSKDYVFYCKGYDRSGRETQLFEIPFTTYAAGSDEIPNFTFSEGAYKDFYLQQYIVTPNELCKQIVLHQQTPEENDAIMYGENNWAGKLLEMFNVWKDNPSDARMKCYVATNKVLDAMAANPSMELEAPLELHILAYDEMYNPFLIKKFSTKSPAADPNAPVINGSDITVTMNEATWETIDFSWNYTSDDIKAVMYDVVLNKWFEETCHGNVSELTDYFKKNYSAFPLIYGVKEGGDTYRDPHDEQRPDTALVPGEDYFIVVFGVNKNGPLGDGFAAEVSMSEVFTLPMK